MFTTLIESRPGHEVHAGETLLSTILHVGLVAAAVVVTAQAGKRERAPVAENVIFTQPAEFWSTSKFLIIVEGE